MSGDRDDVLEAIHALCEEAFATVGPVTGFDPDRMYPWVRANEHAFRLDVESLSSSEIHAASEALPTVPGYEAALRALERDSAIGPVLGHLFGDVFGRSLVEADRLILDVYLRAAPDHPRQSIESRLAQMREAFTRSHLERRVVAPLPGGFHAGVESPVMLDEGTSIRRLEDLDIASALNVGYRFRDMPDAWGLVHVGDAWGIEATYALPVVTGVGDEGEPEDLLNAAMQVQRDANDRVVRVVQALRITKQGPISVIGQMHISDEQVVGGRTIQFSNTRSPRAPVDSYDFEEHDTERMRNIYGLLGHPAVLSSPALETSARRFSSSIERHDREDCLVDLIISAEALFAGDAGAGDLSLRVAQRFARYVEGSSDLSVMELFDHMKAAYNGRSKIVHAAKRTARVQRAITRATDSTALTEDLMRAAIRKALVETAERGAFAIDWDRLVLEGASQSGDEPSDPS